MSTITDDRFDMGRVMSATFGLIGRNFVVFFVIAALFAGAPLALIMFLQSELLSSGDLSALSGIAILGAVLSVVGNFFLQGALTRASIDDLSGRGVSIGNAFGSALRHIFPLFGLSILMGLGLMVGAILLIIPGIILAVRWIVAAPTLVSEEIGITGSMGRSADLTRDHRWAIFGLCFFYVIVTYGVTLLAEQLTGALAMAAGGPGLYSLPALIVLPIVQAVLALIGTVGIAAIYFELRRAKEGIDVTQLAAVFD